MGGLTGGLFGGGGSKETSTQQTGFAALPSDVQADYLEAIRSGSEPALADPYRYFAPMGLSSEEQLARQMIDPSQISANIQNYLNPYSDFAIENINRQFEAPQSALQAAADEAGAFGSSRYRDVASDLEQARLGAIGENLGSQYNTAFSQMQRGIGNLLGFGGLERGIDLAQRQAPIQAASYASGLYEPLLRTGTQQTVRSKGGDGILGGLGNIGGFLSGAEESGLFDYIGDSGNWLNTGLNSARTYFGI